MKKLFGSVIALGLIAHLYGLLGAAADPVRLQDFQWKNRLLVVCALKSEHDLVVYGLPAQKVIMSDENNTRNLAFVWIDQHHWTVSVIGRAGDDPNLSTWLSDLKTKADQTPERESSTTRKTSPTSLFSLTEDSIRLIPYRPDCNDCDAEYRESERLEIATRLECKQGDQMSALIGLDGDVKQICQAAADSEALKEAESSIEADNAEDAGE